MIGASLFHYLLHTVSRCSRINSSNSSRSSSSRSSSRSSRVISCRSPANPPAQPVPAYCDRAENPAGRNDDNKNKSNKKRVHEVAVLTSACLFCPRRRHCRHQGTSIDRGMEIGFEQGNLGRNCPMVSMMPCGEDELRAILGQVNPCRVCLYRCTRSLVYVSGCVCPMVSWVSRC